MIETEETQKPLQLFQGITEIIACLDFFLLLLLVLSGVVLVVDLPLFVLENHPLKEKMEIFYGF